MDRRTGFIVEELYRLGPMSNQELSKHLALSPASITHLLQPLVYHGVLKERPPEEYPEDLLEDDADDGRKRRRKITVTPNHQFGYVLTGEVADGVMRKLIEETPGRFTRAYENPSFEVYLLAPPGVDRVTSR